MSVKDAPNGPRSVMVLPWWPHQASDNECMSLESIKRFAGTLDIVIVAPDELCVPPILKPSRVEVFSKLFFLDAWSYSRLLLTAQFYERLGRYDQIVVVQSDVLLLKPLQPLISRLYPWSYVGAPWVSLEPSGLMHFVGVGNGGFSVRRTRDFLDVLRSPSFPSWPRHVTRQKSVALWFALSCCSVARVSGERMAHLLLRRGIHEDIFWSKVAPCLSSRYMIAPLADALAFSYETFPRFAHQANHDQLPYGVHGWWQHDADFVQDLARR